jgi:hypothetical protein
MAHSKRREERTDVPCHLDRCPSLGAFGPPPWDAKFLRLAAAPTFKRAVAGGTLIAVLAEPYCRKNPPRDFAMVGPRGPGYPASRSPGVLPQENDGPGGTSRAVHRL